MDKLVAECEDEILNTADTISITDRKVTCKNNCLSYINNHVLITSYCFYHLLLLLHKILVSKKIVNGILNIYKSHKRS